MKIQKFSWKEAVSFGWALMKENLPFFIGLLIAAFLIKFIPSQLAEVVKKSNITLYVIVTFLSIFFSVLVNMGLIRVSLKIANKEKGDFFDLFNCYPLFLKYFGSSILYGLVVLGGLILLIVPGIIMAIRCSLYGYLIVDKGLGPIQALKESYKMTKGAAWDLFVFGFIIGGINILGLLALIIGLLATIPATMLATVFVYRKLLLPQPEVSSVLGAEPPKA